MHSKENSKNCFCSSPSCLLVLVVPISIQNWGSTSINCCVVCLLQGLSALRIRDQIQSTLVVSVVVVPISTMYCLLMVASFSIKNWDWESSSTNCCGVSLWQLYWGSTCIHSCGVFLWLVPMLYSESLPTFSVHVCVPDLVQHVVHVDHPDDV